MTEHTVKLNTVNKDLLHILCVTTEGILDLEIYCSKVMQSICSDVVVFFII